MTKWLAYLLLSPLMTPAERDAIKQYVRERASNFCERHLIAGPELSKELDEVDQELVREGK